MKFSKRERENEKDENGSTFKRSKSKKTIKSTIRNSSNVSFENIRTCHNPGQGVVRGNETVVGRPHMSFHEKFSHGLRVILYGQNPNRIHG